MVLPVPDPTSFGMFVLAALVLLLTPGPAVLYIVARSIDQGRRAGLVSMLGVHAGTLVHVASAAAGLSALLAASATAFSTVKYLGAAYLVYLGIRTLLDRAPGPGGDHAAARRLRRAFLDGVIVNVLNPKTASWRSSRNSSTYRAATSERRSSCSARSSSCSDSSPTAPTP
jgi:threonine/homoserine/homoserine lactone efflux protein